jgi:hypothetical protein
VTDEGEPVPGPVAPLHRVALTPDDVGSRVVVRRRRRDAAPGEPPLGDVLGDLVAWTRGELVVRVRSGEHVTVEEHAVVAAKRVPPPPVRRGGRR